MKINFSESRLEGFDFQPLAGKKVSNLDIPDMAEAVSSAIYSLPIGTIERVGATVRLPEGIAGAICLAVWRGRFKTFPSILTESSEVCDLENVFQIADLLRPSW